MKKIIIGTVIAVLAVSAVFAGGQGQSGGGAAAPAASVVTMKFGGTTPANPALGEYDGMLKFAELVAKYSNNTIKVEVYPANQLGNTVEMAEGVALGTIEAGVLGFDTLAAVDKSMNFAAMPYLFKDISHMRSVLENTNGNARKTIDASLSKNANMKLVGIMYRPMRVLTNSRRPVKTPADCRGLKIRSPESAANIAVLTAMGAMPVTISWGEVFTSLSQGVCDGAENAITELASIKLNEIMKYISETNHMAAPTPIVVNEKWFNSLSKEQQDAIVKAGNEATEHRIGTVKEEEDKAWKAFADSGAQVLRAKDIDGAAFEDACKDVYKQFIERGFFTQEFYDAIKSGR
jgi:tripartite ATP-independent transporter DctP family solute receptor